MTLTLAELRALFWLAARHAVQSPGFGMTAFCRIVAANASVLGRAECRVIGALLAKHRPTRYGNQYDTRKKLCERAEQALAARLAALGPERVSKARPLNLDAILIHDTPPKRTGKRSTNPRAG